MRRRLSSLPPGLDGELVAGEFNSTTSAIMSQDGEPEFKYYVFDDFSQTCDYWDRLSNLAQLHLPSWISVLLPIAVSSVEEFVALDALHIASGYEGTIGRCPRGPYREGRSTLREHYMVKWKAYHDSEAVVLSLEEAYTNLNEQVPNAFGHMKRPGGSAMKFPKGTLGSMRVRDVYTSVEFDIGTGIGLTDEVRQRIWDSPSTYIGRIVRYRCQKCGEAEKPRFPSFQGFRDPQDM